MRERAKALIGARAAKHLVISTFHSLGVRLLRSDGDKLGLKPQFSILDSDDVLGHPEGRRRAPPTSHWRAAGNGRSACGRTRA